MKIKSSVVNQILGFLFIGGSILVILFESLLNINSDFSDIYLYIGLALFTIPHLLFYLFKRKINPAVLTVYYIQVITLYYVGLLFGSSTDIKYYDLISGVVYGFSVGLITVYTLTYFEPHSTLNKVTVSLFIFAVPVGAIALWEIIQYFIAYETGLDLQQAKTTGMDDTMWDIIFSLLGVILLVFHYFRYRVQNSMFNIVSYFINE